jgi:myosin heavy subunit
VSVTGRNYPGPHQLHEVCFTENCRNEFLQFMEENYHKIRVASQIYQELRADIAEIKGKQTGHETSILNNKNQINRRTSETTQDDITRSIYRIDNLEKQDRQQQILIENLKKDLQKNAAVRADIEEITRKQTGYERSIQNLNEIETNRKTSERKQDDSTRTLTNRMDKLEGQAEKQQNAIETLKKDLQNKQNQIDTNRRTSKTRQDESTRTTNSIQNLMKQADQQQIMIETLKNDLQKNTASIKVLLNDTSANQETTSRSIEDTPIPTWAIIMLVIWNITLTILCAYYWYSFSMQQSPNQNATSMESPVCINPIYATAADMTTDYSSTQENRSRQLPTKRWPGSKKVIVNPIYQSSVDQYDDGLYSEI